MIMEYNLIAFLVRFSRPELILFGISILGRMSATSSASCRKSLGMQSGMIPDSAITASSSYDHASVGPSNARIRTEKNGGAWCPKSQMNKKVYEWLEIDLKELKTVTQVETQGRFGNGQGQEYANAYRLEYKRREAGNWVKYQNVSGHEIFTGNINTYIAELRDIVPPIVARWIRVVPYSSTPRTVCMRVELYGCPWRDGIVSYSMRQGERKGAEVDLFDFTYDQNSTNGYLTGGLGQLTDGIEGHANFRLDAQDRGRKGYEWVGWKNDSGTPWSDGWDISASPDRPGQPVEIILTFDRIRNFSSIMLHCNNMFSRDVKVFRKALVYFGVNGKDYYKTPVEFDHRSDNVLELARNVVIRVPHRIGRFVKIVLYFDAKWILISEIRTESEPYRGGPISDDPADSIVSDGKMESAELGFDSADQQQLGSKFPGMDSGTSLTGLDATYSLLFIGLVACSSVIIIIVCVALILTRRQTFSKKPNGSVTCKVDRITEFEYKSNPLGSAHPESFQSFGAIANMQNSVNIKKCEDYMNSSLKYVNKPDDVIQHGGDLHTTSYSVLVDHTTDTINKSSDMTSYRQNLYSQKGLEYRQLPDIPVIPPKPAEYYSDTNTSTYARPDALLFTPLSLSRDRTSAMACEPSGSLDLDYSSGFLPSSIHPASNYSSTDFSDRLEGPCGSSMYAVPVDLEEDQLLNSELFNSDLEIDFNHLLFVKILGAGRFGEVRLCELLTDGQSNEVVAVKMLNANLEKSTRQEFLREAAVMSRLDDDNIVSLVGVCTGGQHCCIITEYMQYGDLHQFLLQHQPLETATHLSSNTPTLSQGCLIYMAMQISSGLKYLKSLKMIHRDVATRNCLIGRYFSLKISDFGMSRSLYSKDYYRLDGRAALPIRWMAWESIVLGKFSTMSDVWSFGVTLWEMLNFGRDQPFSDLTDDQVIENSGRFYRLDEEPLYLLPPSESPKEITDLMRECWNREERQRPTAEDIHMFLSRKNYGYNPEEENSPAVRLLA